MKNCLTPKSRTSVRIAARAGFGKATLLKTSLAAMTLSASMASLAVDFGPNGMFSLTGFAEATVGRTQNFCVKCQFAADTEGKDKVWADPILNGQPIKTVTETFWQAQPYLGVKYDLGNGFSASALLSQRWRDGAVNGQKLETRYGGLVDVPNFWYEKNVAISHEDYGSLHIGAMTTRAWNVADYPYGTNIGLSSAWGSSGAGYGMLTNAVRYTSRILDFAEGDLVLEATYDRGNNSFTINKPKFWELYGQFHKGDLVLDAMYQNGINGGPGAWGHAPFTSLTPYAADDSKLTGSHQGIAMIMGRYQLNSQAELSAGIRANRWSGANAMVVGSITTPIGPSALWNNMFNVDWNAVLPGGGSPGYAASSTDTMLGLRYRFDKLTASTGLVYLGKATTDNPMERGQSNAAMINTFGMQYDLGAGLKFESTIGFVHYDHLGLSPLSMPGNSSFSDVDSRISKSGSWVTVGMVYAF